MGQFIDLCGQVFDRLTVIRQADNRGRLVAWECRCSCGKTTLATTKKLRNGRKRSCGCAWLPAVLDAKTRHGHSANRSVSPELRIWMNMRARCNAPGSTGYARYGGRGITVCARWDDFSLFLTDMGHRPSRAHSLERKDNDGPYSPENCRWATAAEQARNTRRNVLVTFGGQTMCATDAARLTGIKEATLRYRIRAGWPASRLFEPVAA